MSDILYVLLPNGRQQFLDANGAPLASGSVGMYTPGTLDPKETWQDPEGSSANENPVLLDAAGSALIYGVGQYRQIVKDSFGTTIWDALTYGIAPTGGTVVPGGFGAQEELSSATTTDLGTIGSHNVLITGSTDIANFGASATLDAPLYLVSFDGDPAVIQGSTTILLPGASDIPTSAGDSMLVEYLGGGLWRVLAYWPEIGLYQGFGQQLGIAASAVPDIGTLLTNNALIQGTATITGFGSSASVLRPVFLVAFDTPGVVLTNGSDLALPGGTNIVVAAGDSLLARYIGAGQWIVLSYFRFSGRAPIEQLSYSYAFYTGAFDVVLPVGLTPATRIRITCVAPGGGGGGCGTGNVGGGSGAGSGAAFCGTFYGFAPGAHLTGTVSSAGGAGGTNADGSPGGGQSKLTYSATDFLVCNPGGAGVKSANAGGAPGSIVLSVAPAGLTLEATLFSGGGPGSPSNYASSDVNVSGAGGGNPWGQGGAPRVMGSGGAGVDGVPGEGYGAGGGGACGSEGSVGGEGAPGLVLIEILA